MDFDTRYSCQSPSYKRRGRGRQASVPACGRSFAFYLTGTGVGGILRCMSHWTRWAIFLLAPISVFSANVAKISVHVRMRDGVRLATDAYGTEQGVKKPVLLMRTPYNKNGSASVAAKFVNAGYAVVIQDCRGRYGSEG